MVIEIKVVVEVGIIIEGCVALQRWAQLVYGYYGTGYGVAGCLLGGPSEEWLTFFVSRKAPTNSVQPAKVIEG